LSISSTFYEQLLRRYSFGKKLQSQTAIREKLRKALSYKKGLSKILMKFFLSVFSLWCQFHQRLTRAFLYESKLSSFSLNTFSFVIFGDKILFKKNACVKR